MADETEKPSEFSGKLKGVLSGFRETGVASEVEYFQREDRGNLSNKYKEESDTTPPESALQEEKAIPVDGIDDTDDVEYVDNEPLLAELKFIEERKDGDAEHVAQIRKLLDGETISSAQSPYLFGIGLSGGGIRSAIFCLGVLQKLAATGILKHADYLSTVSGGGYIGSALTWWLTGKTNRTNKGSPPKFDVGEQLPFGTTDPAKPDDALTPIMSYLRQNGKYLIPGNGITLVSGVAIVLRAILLNLLVWIPIVTSIFLAIKWGGDKLSTSGFEVALLLAIMLAALFAASCLNYSFVAWSSRKPDQQKTNALACASVTPKHLPWYKRLFAAIVKYRLAAFWFALNILALALGLALIAILVGQGVDVLAIIGVDATAPNMVSELNAINTFLMNPQTAYALFVLVIVLSALLTLKFFGERWWMMTALVMAVAIILMSAEKLTLTFLFVLIVASFVWLTYFLGKRVRSSVNKDGFVSERYSGRRAFEIVSGLIIIFIAILGVFGSVPYVYEEIIGKEYAETAGVSGVVGGIASAFWGFLQSRGKGGGGRFTGLILAVGSSLFVYGLLLLGFHLSEQVYIASTDAHSNIWIVTGFWIFFLVAVISGWFTNLNYVSLGRYYRDRLMEAFMPDYETVNNQDSAPASLADNLKFAHLWRSEKGCAAHGPYPIVNTNVVLVNSTVRKYAMRGGDNFAITPLLCGGNAVGWTPTESFDSGEMTVASAMAISGAAANPRGGVGGKGPTTNRFVSFVMTLLNFRLGYWVNRPNKKRLPGWRRRPSHFYPSAAYSLPGKGYKEDSTFLELADGGHFENLAIYELVRRRCGLIIICDGGQDSAASYSDFVTAIQRIGQDFGAEVKFDLGSGPEQMVPTAKTGLYPKNTEYAEKGYFAATIDYGKRGGGAWPEQGLLIYLKTTMIDDLSMTAKGYQGAHKEFPDQSTGDQFFDEEQFEAYREVGYRIGEQMVCDLELDKEFKKGRPDIKKWIKAHQKKEP